ncbi:hypothetical protein ACWF2D_18310, partial [Bacillus subtilis]
MFHILCSVPRFFTRHIRVTGYDVKALMAEHQIRSLSILENDQMTGIVALGDLSVEKRYWSKSENSIMKMESSRHGDHVCFFIIGKIIMKGAH